jgi:MFS family permease
MSFLGGRIMHRVGVRRMVVAGVFLLTIGFVLLTRLGPGAPLANLMIDMAIMGTGMGLVMLTIIIAVQAAVPKERLGIATSFSMFARSIGGAIGVASMGAVLASQLSVRLAALNIGGEGTFDPNGMLNPALRASMAPETLTALESALAESLRGVFEIGVVVAVLAFVSALWLPTKLAIGHARSGGAASD